MFRASIVGRTFAVSRIPSTGPTLWRKQTLFGESWSSKGRNGIMREVLDLLGDIAWNWFLFRRVNGTISTLQYQTIGITYRIVLLRSSLQ